MEEGSPKHAEDDAAYIFVSTRRYKRAKRKNVLTDSATENWTAVVRLRLNNGKGEKVV